MLELLYTKALVIHILAAMVGVGTVTVTDYLHVLGIRDPTIERHAHPLFPLFARLIVIALLLIYITGIVMVLAKPALLSSTLFRTKLLLVIIVTLNGFWLHKKVFPMIEACEERGHCPRNIVYIAAIAGSISIITWYAIVVLAITKSLGYHPLLFLLLYAIAIAIAYTVAVHFEKRQYRKHSNN